MIAFPNAKVNIGLNVLSKRPDGYHNIETLFYPVLLQDALEITLMRPLDPAQIRKRIEAGFMVQSEEIFSNRPLRRRREEISCCSLEMTGNTFPFHAADNLVVKAYLMLLEDFDLPSIDIRLYKHIPSSAGLGGGSSDGAFMISLLNRRFNLRMRDSMMMKYAARLGSDCPFFILNVPSLAAGRGEILTPISLSLRGYNILLVKPDISVSTARAYSEVTPCTPQIPLAEAIKRPVSEWRDCVFNDFESGVFKRYPLLAEIKERLYKLGAEYASMSGSGSTIFGLFRTPLKNEAELFPDMFVCQREMA
ncbi:MAG TPA: 4-(cytidine 5'-diphospho)-2-C-methyl-D-erythritol kinase [Bacteroidaceae bacterium]|jgi:4-diphosphocytidyl-2-C-methyl-D-erythritol kinase|nr:4-(cytidine 5'-diphospho)-2-C-methyl-D-erythritol kinase [Bacteroidaceae bacterium]HOD69147.1 4-(cytidine 5'-diphospho)-2-C-methyl-D-erythritol kinase [Bacteroidaceae bacterium]HPB03522.1 4-(cytidine 5'-diphospho)-2-C-methyl-D-erythritol kinase [Bacteroidaceae bacterium]HQL26637.1 4-(cytidine 5'-diphospho)-2-C-methyl-D-erythritol kinase [Bacteroidaceae bacterium]